MSKKYEKTYQLPTFFFILRSAQQFQLPYFKKCLMIQKKPLFPRKKKKFPIMIAVKKIH